ncbi:hypothetical protein Q5H92_14510 [Hymenobacter sp. M29]|uniref:Uncharacterized protein n=1 Tax=Hymenobacter mellowenesis TaxID=3063995 RepID=A0ABT9ADY0_9BACT|nr:hypothetical protein [Hymenobacter sp. M29]MDO7847579.1 hypothetical protein [Hymenobacter sp. M29]
MTKEPTPLEKLLLKLEGKVPDDLLEEVSDFLYEQEEELKSRDHKIDELEEEKVDLEGELATAEAKSEETPYVYDICAWVEDMADYDQERVAKALDIPLILLNSTSDIMLDIYAQKLEEYINQHGVESTLDVLTQDHSQEVEELRDTVQDLKEDNYHLTSLLEEAKEDLEKYAQF